MYVSICIRSLTVGHILIEMIAIGLIALHMIIGPRCCGRCIHRWRSKCTRCLCIKFSGKLMNTREWASERGEIHHDRLCFYRASPCTPSHTQTQHNTHTRAPATQTLLTSVCGFWRFGDVILYCRFWGLCNTFAFWFILVISFAIRTNQH